MSGDDGLPSDEHSTQSASSSDSEEAGSSHSSCQGESSGGENDDGEDDGEFNLPDEIMNDISIEVVSASSDEVRSDFEVCLTSLVREGLQAIVDEL